MLPYLYLVPALYFNATVKTGLGLGDLSTGGGLILANALTATLQSEPGFEPSFVASVLYGEDYPTTDPADGIVRSNFKGLVVPHNGDTPFQMTATGIQVETPELLAILGGNSSGIAVPYGATYSVWLPKFRGGSSNYASLQNTFFIGSETLSSGPNPGEFLVGVKISQVVPRDTGIVIGQEFP